MSRAQKNWLYKEVANMEHDKLCLRYLTCIHLLTKMLDMTHAQVHVQIDTATKENNEEIKGEPRATTN